MCIHHQIVVKVAVVAVGDGISLIGGRHLSQLGVDSLETVEHLSKLSFTDLEHDLLVLLISTSCLVFLKVHLDI